MAVSLEESRASSTSTILVLVGMVMYSLVAYGIGTHNELFISMIGKTLAVPAAIYVYFGVATLAYRGKFTQIALGGTIAIILGAYFSNANFLLAMGSEWGMLLSGGLLIGMMAAQPERTFKAFLFGLGAVLIMALIWLLPQIGKIQESILAVGNEALETMKISGLPLGDEVPSEQMIKTIVGWWSRLTPGTLVISFITQYSIGALLFLGILDRANPEKKRLAPFSRWQMPFWTLLLLPLSVSARFLIGGTTGLIADNLLLILSVFYCVTGLSLLDYYMGKIRLSILAKIVVYILFIPLGLLGYMGLCLFSVLDSFFDWRGINEQDEQLKKSAI